MTINRDFFFSHVRLHLFGGGLKQAQVGGLTSILDEWERNHVTEDDRWLAYMLATAHHETDRRFQPIREYGTPERFDRLYGIQGVDPDRARRMGHTKLTDGRTFYGRGFVQLTWKNNYERAGIQLGLAASHFVNTPDDALRLDYATQILFTGMIGGWFTGKRLATYFNPAKDDWVNARRIINGTDKAQLVADYGRAFYAAISYKT